MKAERHGGSVGGELSDNQFNWTRWPPAALALKQFLNSIYVGKRIYVPTSATKSGLKDYLKLHLFQTHKFNQWRAGRAGAGQNSHLVNSH